MGWSLLYPCYWFVFSEIFNHRNSGISQIMGKKKKRASNGQHPKPQERTFADQNFAQTVKTLFRLIQCINHSAIANNQLNGTVSQSSEDKLTDLNQFVKAACLTASLSQQLIISRWIHDVTDSLLSHFRERPDAFKRQLSAFRLNFSDS